MNREILFRGKRIDNGEWIEGSLVSFGDKGKAILPSKSCVFFSHRKNVMCCEECFDVDPSTVGQYTGLTDQNGKRIFEGDIVEGGSYTDEDGYGVVEWCDGAFEVGNGQWCGTFHANYNGSEFEVIGNIHDNPELLKEEPT